MAEFPASAAVRAIRNFLFVRAKKIHDSEQCGKGHKRLTQSKTGLGYGWNLPERSPSRSDL
jgi:hypothetical protein